MLNRPQTYYFGRLNLITPYQDKRDLLYQGLVTKELLTIRNFNWGFFNIESFSDTTGEYFTGYLAKYKPVTEEEKADEELHRISLEEADKRINAKARFFLHIESSLVAYHHVGRKIMRQQFANNFYRLFELAHDRFFVRAEIQSIDERYEIFETIIKMDYISKVSLYLHPSNPSPGIWKDVDDRLKKLRASQYKEEYLSKKDESLEIIDDHDFNSKLNMAVDGYGEANIRGSLDGQEQTVRTGDNPVTTETFHEDKEPQNVFNDLRNKILEIFRRF